MAKPIPRLSPEQIARVIEVAWDDRPPFRKVLLSHGLTEGQVVQLLKRELTANAFKVWKARASSSGQPAAVARPPKLKPKP